MNQIKLSLRSADDPRTIKEDNGTATFASVFALHNAPPKKGKPLEIVPITVKASRELAPTLVESLGKGTAFVVTGQVAYYRHPDTARESYSIWADTITDVVPAKNQTQPTAVSHE
ncbi:MAG: hypothetical protein WA771_00835 [Chthoniobacterales bacterium]